MAVHAALALVKKDGKILFVTNRRYKTLGLPGGKCDVFEGASECAARELLEETGLYADWIDLVPIIMPVMSGALNGHVVQVFFVKKARGQAHEVEEGTRVSFIDPDIAFPASKWSWWFTLHLPEGLLNALPDTEIEDTY